MLSVYFADEMTNTPFDLRRRERNLASIGFAEVDAPGAADVIVSRRLLNLLPHFPLKRKYHIWTHEPFWLPLSDMFLIDRSTGMRVTASTAYNGDIYISPLFYFPFLTLDLDKVISLARKKTQHCVFLSTYRGKSDRYIGNVNVDLSALRQNLATLLAMSGECDIFGRSWPSDIPTLGGGKDGDWHNTKLGIIEAYRFNVACENTITHNYITEKFWDAIRAGCIPVYFADGTGIDQVSDPRSFIDCSRGTTFDDISERMHALSRSDAEEMVAIGVRAFNRIAASASGTEIRNQYLFRFRDRLLAELDGS